MPLCRVTVAGQTLEVEAASLHYACINYNAEQVAGSARRYPRLTPETEITVEVEGRAEVYRVKWQTVLNWANRVANRK